MRMCAVSANRTLAKTARCCVVSCHSVLLSVVGPGAALVHASSLSADRLTRTVLSGA